MTEKLGNICSDVLNAKEDEAMEMNREKIIELVKALGITAEELGIKPEIKTITEKDTQFIHEVSQMIIGMDIEEEARDNINEKYWDDLGIRPEKKYKVVGVKVKKEIYKEIKVVMPDDEDSGNVENYIGNMDYLDNDYPDDEEDWEIDDYDTLKEELTAKEICYHYNTDDIWNYNDFEDM